MATPTRVVCIVLAVQAVSASGRYYRNEGLMDHLSNGMKFAQNLLGSESVALKVADFVVRAFSSVNTASDAGGPERPAASYVDQQSGERPGVNDYQSGERPGVNEHAGSPWRYMVRLLGLQPSQLSAVAVNALVFVAQMLTSFLAGPSRPGRPLRSEGDDPTDWILNKNSRRLQDIIATAKNDSLPDLVEELVTGYGSREETACIRLLVCKITPFISRMQDAVFRKTDGRNFSRDVRGAAAVYRHLPPAEEIRDRSDRCEKKFPDCELHE